MTQFTQRFIAALLVVLLFGAVMPTHAAAAANTSDKPFSFSISDTRKRTGYRRKYNSTPVYVYYTVENIAGFVHLHTDGWILMMPTLLRFVVTGHGVTEVM